MIEQAKQDARGDGNTEKAEHSTKTNMHTNYIIEIPTPKMRVFCIGLVSLQLSSASNIVENHQKAICQFYQFANFCKIPHPF